MATYYFPSASMFLCFISRRFNLVAKLKLSYQRFLLIKLFFLLFFPGKLHPFYYFLIFSVCMYQCGRVYLRKHNFMFGLFVFSSNILLKWENILRHKLCHLSKLSGKKILPYLNVNVVLYFLHRLNSLVYETWLFFGH